MLEAAGAWKPGAATVLSAPLLEGGSSNRCTDSKTTQVSLNLKPNPKPRVSPPTPEYLLLGQSE